MVPDAVELEELLDLAQKVDRSSELYRRVCETLVHVEEVTRSSRRLAPETGLIAWPILKSMSSIEGWLNENEADLLIAATALAVTTAPAPSALVEVGSYCGRSTCVIASVAKALGATAKVYAIDPHEGRVGAEGQEIEIKTPTLEKIEKNLQDAAVADQVTIIQCHSWEVAWDKPVSLLFIDGLHDYYNVSRDFRHFEPWLVVGGYGAFHDYSSVYPGVVAFVYELLRDGRYEKIDLAGSMFVIRKIAPTALCQ
jgi:hypothetical protein